MSFYPESIQSLMMISGLGILCWVFLRKWARRRRRTEPAVITKRLGHNANASGQLDRFSGTQSLGAPPDVLKWQVELHDLGRDLKAELDSKMIAVRSLTRQYDQAARRLSELIRLAEQVSPSTDTSSIQARHLLVVTELKASGWSDRRIADALELPIEFVEACAGASMSTLDA